MLRISTRLAEARGCVGVVPFRPCRLTTTEEWAAFLDGLSSPGILKVLRFAVDCGNSSYGNVAAREALDGHLIQFISHYVGTIQRLWDLENDDADDLPEVRRLTAECITMYIRLVHQIRTMQRDFVLISQVAWLLETDSLERFAAELLSSGD